MSTTGPETTLILPPCTPLPDLNVMLPPTAAFESPDSNSKDPPMPSSDFPADNIEREPPDLIDLPVFNTISPAIPDKESPVEISTLPLLR